MATATRKAGGKSSAKRGSGTSARRGAAKTAGRSGGGSGGGRSQSAPGGNRGSAGRASTKGRTTGRAAARASGGRSDQSRKTARGAARASGRSGGGGASSGGRSRKSAGGSRARSGAGGGSSRSSQATVDHEQIRQWAEDRGGQPSCVRGTGGGDDVGMLRIDFPGYSGADSLQPISWDEFFEKFDERGLALMYQDTTRGQKSNFNKLVSRDDPKVRKQLGGAPAGRR